MPELKDVLHPKSLEHWERTQEDRARHEDRGCVCPLCLSMPGIIEALSDTPPTPPQYRFTMKYVMARDDPYFMVRWDQAKTATVVASNRTEAFQNLWELLGSAPMHAHWTAKITKTEAV